MYILFINLGGKCDIFFSAQFNNNSNKKKLSNPWVQLDSTKPMWVGLGWTYVIGWVGLNFFLTHHSGLSKKIPSTRPKPTHAHFYIQLQDILSGEDFWLFKARIE